MYQARFHFAIHAGKKCAFQLTSFFFPLCALVITVIFYNEIAIKRTFFATSDSAISTSYKTTMQPCAAFRPVLKEESHYFT